MLARFIAVNYTKNKLDKQLMLILAVFSLMMGYFALPLLAFATEGLVSNYLLASLGILITTLLADKIMGWRESLHNFCEQTKKDFEEAQSLDEKLKRSQIESEVLRERKLRVEIDQVEKLHGLDVLLAQQARQEKEADLNEKNRQKSEQERIDLEARLTDTLALEAAVLAGNITSVKAILAKNTVDLNSKVGRKIIKSLVEKAGPSADHLAIFKLLLTLIEQDALLWNDSDKQTGGFYGAYNRQSSRSCFREVLVRCDHVYLNAILEIFPNLAGSAIEKTKKNTNYYAQPNRETYFDGSNDNLSDRRLYAYQPLKLLISEFILKHSEFRDNKFENLKACIRLLVANGAAISAKVITSNRNEVEIYQLLAANTVNNAFHCNRNISAQDYTDIVRLIDDARNEFQLKSGGHTPQYLIELTSKLAVSPAEALEMVKDQSRIYPQMPYYFMQLAADQILTEQVKELVALYPPMPNDMKYQAFCYEVASYFLANKEKDKSLLKDAFHILLQAISVDSVHSPEKNNNITLLSYIFHEAAGLPLGDTFDFEIEGHVGSMEWLAVLLSQFTSLYQESQQIADETSIEVDVRPEQHPPRMQQKDEADAPVRGVLPLFEQSHARQNEDFRSKPGDSNAAESEVARSQNKPGLVFGNKGKTE